MTTEKEPTMSELIRPWPLDEARKFVPPDRTVRRCESLPRGTPLGMES